MSGKRRKKQARSRQPVRPALAPISPLTSSGEGASPNSSALASTPVRGDTRPAPASRYAGSVTAPRRGAVATTTTGTIDIDERVPYFAQDLRRILVTAVVMIAAIIAGSLLLH